MGRANKSGSELRGHDGPVSRPVAQHGPTKEKLLPCTPPPQHDHHPPRVRPPRPPPSSLFPPTHPAHVREPLPPTQNPKTNPFFREKEMN